MKNADYSKLALRGRGERREEREERGGETGAAASSSPLCLQDFLPAQQLKLFSGKHLYVQFTVHIFQMEKGYIVLIASSTQSGATSTAFVGCLLSYWMFTVCVLVPIFH